MRSGMYVCIMYTFTCHGNAHGEYRLSNVGEGEWGDGERGWRGERDEERGRGSEERGRGSEERGKGE